MTSLFVVYMFLVVKIQHYHSLYNVFALYVVDAEYIRGRKQKASAPCGADAVFRFKRLLELWTCSNESLTSLIACVLGEVLDETASQVNCLLLPL